MRDWRRRAGYPLKSAGQTVEKVNLKFSSTFFKRWWVLRAKP